MTQALFRNVLFKYFSTITKQTRGLANSLPVNSKKVPEEALPKNTIEQYISAHKQPFGEIYDKRPFKMKLQANVKYAWCSCGHSKSQPLCDGTHRIFSLGIKNKPVFFKVEEAKEYWLCNCKQSLHRPFCDGTHLREDIQSAIKYYKT